MPSGRSYRTSRSSYERRHRSPNRSRYRRRSRSRSRSRSPRDSRRRHRSRSPIRHRRDTKSEKNLDEKSTRNETDPKNLRLEGAIDVSRDVLDKDVEQRRLEVEMQKRRERIERWRAEKKKMEDKASGAPIVPGLAPPKKSWNLEDDDDEDDDMSAPLKKLQQQRQLGTLPLAKKMETDVKEEEKTTEEMNENEEEEVEEGEDPLEAYMQGIQQELRKHRPPISKLSKKEPGEAGAAEGPQVTVIRKVVASSKPEPAVSKGELMESNIDGMEYSSEEEEETIADAIANANRSGKEKLSVVDHTKVYYAPFRKDFYVEVPEIKQMTDKEVSKLREQLDGIRARGKNVPRPVRSWAQCGVSAKVLQVLKRHKWEKPTPIQCQALPVTLSGRDMIGIAKTGSGKTLAFLLPMLRHIEDQPELGVGDGPIAVIMTPTRELALQIYKECKKFTSVLDLHVVCVYGGTEISEQIAKLKRGAEIVVCTPGRMIDMLAANSGRVTNLRRCTYIVLDEADRMFDMGFEPQVMRVIDNVRPNRQTVMFSATFPRQMEALARKILDSPVEVQVGGRSVVCKDVHQHVVLLEEEEKFFKLLELLGIYQEFGSVIVFVEKQENADELMRQLMRNSYPCLALHGGIDQYDRDSIMNDFKKGEVRLLVATSVAARGLDVRDLILVVNYDVPSHYEDYVHRCGRTGRAGNEGTAYTFLTPDQERKAGDLVRAFQQSAQDVPADLQKMWDDYKTRMESEGKRIYTSSGFRGKGFQFDEAESQLSSERRRFQKAALGLADSDDEDAGVDLDQQIENMFASKKKVTSVSEAALIASIKGAAAAAAGGASGLGGGVSNMKKLELAKKMASKIKFPQLAPTKDATQVAAEAILKGGSFASTPQVSSKTLAEQLAEKLHARLGYTPKDEKDGDAANAEAASATVQRYEEELEINDFPQNVRWRITGRETLNNISDYCDVGISVRGVFMPTGKKVEGPPVLPHLQNPDDRPLYLVIESISELNVQAAKKEITRIIKEELLKLQTSNQSYSRGRYKVL